MSHPTVTRITRAVEASSTCKVVSTRLEEDIRFGRPLKLDLGGGSNPKPGFYNVDRVQVGRTDMLAELSFGLPAIKTSSVSNVYSAHTLEHVTDLVFLMEEIHRICAPKANIQIIVPHFSNTYGYSDPTHVRFFGIYSMYYFSDPVDQPMRKVPAHYSHARFRVKRIKLAFYRTTFIDKFFGRLIECWVNGSFQRQEWYERRIAHIFHARQLEYELEPV